MQSLLPVEMANKTHWMQFTLAKNLDYRLYLLSELFFLPKNDLILFMIVIL